MAGRGQADAGHGGLTSAGGRLGAAHRDLTAAVKIEPDLCAGRKDRPADESMGRMISATIIGPFRNFVLAHDKWLMVIIPSLNGIFACHLFSQAESMTAKPWNFSMIAEDVPT